MGWGLMLSMSAQFSIIVIHGKDPLLFEPFSTFSFRTECISRPNAMSWSALEYALSNSRLIKLYIGILRPAGMVFSGKTSCTSICHSNLSLRFCLLISNTSGAGFVTISTLSPWPTYCLTRAIILWLISRNERILPFVVFLSKSAPFARCTSILSSKLNLLLISNALRLSYISGPQITPTQYFFAIALAISPKI